MSNQSTDNRIDVLGSMAFTPVKNDMVGNIKVSPLTLLPSPFLTRMIQRLTERRKSATAN
jgi:hypothetical protein